MKFANKIQSSTLSDTEVKLAVTTRLMPALLYSLPATTLTEVECTKIMAPMKEKILPKMRVVRTISNSVLFGPLRYQGLGLLHLHTFQCTTHISMLMKFFGTATDIGIILNHSLEALNMETGLDGNPFQYNYKIFKECVALGWFKHLWEFVTANNIKLHRCTHVPTPIHLLPQRDNDTLVMKILVDNGYKGNLLRVLNSCRLYLKVRWLSDIVTADGVNLIRLTLKGRRSNMYSTKCKWPLIPKPPLTFWTMWRKALRQCLHLDRTNNLALPHHLRLGNWN